MAMIRQADLETSPKRALVLNLENIRAQADLVMAQTREAAAATLAEAREARERLLAGAAEKGRAAGHAEGLARGLAEGRERGRAEAKAEAGERLAALEAAWSGALAEFTALRADMLRECEARGLELALLMGERVARRAIEVDRTAVQRRVGAILELAARGSRLAIAISPGDEALVREALPGLLAADVGGRHVEVVLDPTLGLGSCVARGEGGGVLDGRVDSMIRSLVDEIVPGAEHRAANGGTTAAGGHGAAAGGGA